MKALADRPWSWMRAEAGDADGSTLVSGRRIYILPSRFGLLYGVLLFLMLLGSLNYDNQPAYLLSFVLLSLGLNAMYQTWRNLRGLKIKALRSEPVFVGHEAILRYRLSSPEQQARYAIQLSYQESDDVDDIAADGTPHLYQLQLQASQRGWLQIPRLLVSSRYPFGLFYAWCYIEPPRQVLIYPQPAEFTLPAQVQPQQGREGSGEAIGVDDFVGLRDYRPGDAPRHIDWKSFARERGLMSKLFASPKSHELMFDWQTLGSHDTEWKLSVLTRAVIDAEQNGMRYALRLPGRVIEAGSGAAHRHACLSALACYKPAADTDGAA